MAEPLYNKYRPLVLDQVWGQKKVVTAFKKHTKEGSFPRTILLNGITGLGKSTLEKIISKTILCKHKDSEGNPCNECESCRTVIQEKISNFYFLKNASNLGIDEMRELEEIANTYEFGIDQKVIVIDEFQEIASNQKASRNILKILEKQSSYTTFILCTMDDSKINKAIKDRCVVYNLHKLDIEDIGSNLVNICEKEGIEIDEEKANVLLTIADSVDGSMRGALSYLERCLDSDIWTVEEAIKELNIVSKDSLTTAMNYLLTGDIKVLDLKFTKELIDRLRYLLNIVFKGLNKYELNSYENSCIKGLNVKAITMEAVLIAYEELNKLFLYAYPASDLIEYHLIRIVQGIKNLNIISLLEEKKSISEEDIQPVRRRR